MNLDKIVNLINTNFEKDDLLVSLTYKSKCKPTIEEAKIDIQEYIKRIKRYRFENGLGELEYFHVIISKDKRRGISHKILIKSMDEKVAEALWEKGYANAGRLKEDESIEMIGRYITKDLKDSSNYSSYKFEGKHNHQEDTKETAPEGSVQEQFQNEFKNGSKIKISISIEFSSLHKNDFYEILQYFAQCSRNFYLMIAKKVNN